MFTITPLTEKEIDALSMMPEGIYNFEVSACEKKKSKKGNPMAELTLTVWDNQGVKHSLKDYLVFSNVGLCIRKIKHFCESTGIEGEYLSGQIRENFLGLSGKVNIGIQDETEKEDGSGFYSKKNIVIDYVVTPKDAKSMPLANKPFDSGIEDDELPF